MDAGRLEQLEQEFRHVEAQLADPDVIADQTRCAEIAKRYHELQPVAEAAAALRKRRGDLEVAREMAAETTGDDRDFAREEVAAAEAEIDELVGELQLLLLPKDPNDDRGVIVEIRGAEGGEEANLFARDLFVMYEGFAARRGWKLEVLGAAESAPRRLHRGHLLAPRRRRVDRG